MALTPGEHDRLLLFTQGELARSRRARGLRLNIPEATALIADAVCEWARDGLTLREARDRAHTLLTVDDVLPGVAEAIGPVRVEARFDDGTRLVVVDPAIAGATPAHAPVRVLPEPAGIVTMTNESAVPIGITSHVHLAEVNPRVRLDRGRAFGCRLAIASGETVWLMPGEPVDLPVTPIRGERVVAGTSGLVDGGLDDPHVRARALDALRACGYLDVRDGSPAGTIDDAEHAVANAMRLRGEHVEGGAR